MSEKSPIALVTGKGQKPRSFLKKIRPCSSCGREMKKSGNLLHCSVCGKTVTVWGAPVKWELKEKFKSPEIVKKLKEKFGYDTNPTYVSSALEDLYEAIENFEKNKSFL